GGAAGAAAGLQTLVPGPVAGRGVPGGAGPTVLDGRDAEVEITIREVRWLVDGRERTAVTMNGSVPGPLLRLREGGEAVIHVHNELDESTSIHWHGLILPNEMDGVPGLNFPGIAPGQTFTYRFPVVQAGTYWYHSHSGFQEQIGHFGAMIIEPAGDEPDPVDREHVVILSDWTFENPHRIMARLKKHPDYYNNQRRTLGDFFADVSEQGLGATLSDRLDWGRMRMMASDISDITGSTYTYLVNGRGPEDNWTGLFTPGERVKLRFINAAAASFFDVRIPGLPLTIVQADGQPVTPVEVDEFRIAIAETYDVIVEPAEDRAYTVFAEAMDRSGFARGTLAPTEGMEGGIPPRRERALLTMADMGHGDHAGHDMGQMEEEAGAMEHEGHDMPPPEPEPMDHAGHDMGAMAGMDPGPALRAPGTLPDDQMHGPDEHGAGNAGVAMTATSRLDEAGIGLGDDGWRVLRYSDLEAREVRPNFRAPDREIELHLTGNMERYMWSIDGVHFRDADPIEVRYGERIRLTMINDTMMNHPMHLHGMWMELENGRGDRIPRAHTINVKPAEKISLLFDADALGPWAFHCHVLYHMDAGMFRIVNVVGDAVADDHDAHDGEDA
ncbi:MAG: copper resistance system multicopper oxidase, partial [Gemmatimonadetes bacterium]|nr:copper resistance system multicopper oxidase [Gemmatimonadota bacterium]